MVQEQLLSRGIKDWRVIKAMSKVPRHLFVPEALADKAYLDLALPIGYGQTISQPYTVALMLEALELEEGNKVLEIGTGSGYMTALLAELCQRVFSVERIPELAQRARRLLDALGYEKVLIKVGDGSVGWPEEAPFDKIVVSASAPQVPSPLLSQLKEGGKMVIPVIVNGQERLFSITALSNGYKREDLGPCRFVKLIGKEGWKDDK